jgi:hypothetical protein
MKIFASYVAITALMFSIFDTTHGAAPCTGPLANFCGISASCIQSNTVVASNFATPAGPLVTGIGNYAVFLNSFGVNSGDFVLWGDTPASNISSGITLDANTGYITLPAPGIFLVMYSVKFNLQNSTAGTGMASVYQGPAAGPLVQITPAPSIMGIFGVTDDANISQPLLTGYALISVTSSTNNTIGLNIQLFNGMGLFGAQGDLNAELVVLQLR